MKSHMTINLSAASQMYDQFRYPAGEWQVRLKPEIEAMVHQDSVIRVIARINTPEDIIKLALLRSTIAPKRHIFGAPYVQLVLPYLPYCRADRRFVPGDCAGLEVFGSLISSMDWDDVFTLDAHNHEAAASAIPHLIDRKPTTFIHRAIKDFADSQKTDRLSILFPDEGARKRYHIPSEIACNAASVKLLEVFHCHKRRDPATGKLDGFEVPRLPERPALLIDDICDGGGSFIGIASKIAEQERQAPPLGLYVSHGIFSKGIEALLDYFGHIYTTNSFDVEYAEEARYLTFFDALSELQ